MSANAPDFRHPPRLRKAKEEETHTRGTFSMHQITRNEGNLVTVRATGKWTPEDYDQLIPARKRVIEERVRYFDLTDLREAERWI